MNARTLALPASLNAPAAAPSGIAAVVSAFIAVVRGVIARPAPLAAVSDADIPSTPYAPWRDLSAELLDVQYGYVADLRGAARRYMDAAAR